MPSSPIDLHAGRAHSVPAHPELRRHRRQVARWALANGHHLERDALAVIVAVRSDGTTGRVARRWTADDIGRVLWSDAPIWCSVRAEYPNPEIFATTLATYLRYLSGHRLLDQGSEPMAVLRRAVADHRPSSRSRHPANGQRLPAPVLPIS